MQSKAASVKEYLASLPADRRVALERVREVILANLDPVMQECMQYGMIGYSVPHRVYPAGYHCDPKQPLPFAGLASQKQHMSLYISGCYSSPDEEARFRREWLATGKKLDMGRSCVRFKRIEDVPLDVVGAAVKRMTAARFIAAYEAALRANESRKKAGAAKSPKKPKEAAATPAKRSPKASKKTTRKTSRA